MDDGLQFFARSDSMAPGVVDHRPSIFFDESSRADWVSIIANSRASVTVSHCLGLVAIHAQPLQVVLLVTAALVERDDVINLNS